LSLKKAIPLLEGVEMLVSIWHGHYIVGASKVEFMNAVLEHERPQPLSAEDLFQFWLRHSNEFMAWQRQNFIAREARAHELQEHQERLELMIGLTLHVYSVASHSLPDVLRTITGRLRQLEDSRSLIHNPMTEQEADAILSRAFPDEPAIGGAA
jgi:hypothetical protein